MSVVALMVVVALAGSWIRAQRQAEVATSPAGTRLAAIGRVAVSVPAGWAEGAATCNAPTTNTVYFPYPQDCLELDTRRVSSVALTSTTQQQGLEPTGRVDGHQVVAGPTDCRTRVRTCVEVFGVPDLHAYVTVAVPRTSGTEPFDVIDGIRRSLTVLPEGQTAVPFVSPDSGLGQARATLEAAGLRVEVRTHTCPTNAFCGTGVQETVPAAGRVVPAGSTVRVVVLTQGR